MAAAAVVAAAVITAFMALVPGLVPVRVVAGMVRCPVDWLRHHHYPPGRVVRTHGCVIGLNRWVVPVIWAGAHGGHATTQ